MLYVSGPSRGTSKLLETHVGAVLTCLSFSMRACPRSPALAVFTGRVPSWFIRGTEEYS